MAKRAEYDNQSITSLKGAERVRKRPAVIFGSDGLEGCQHAIFEIISNSIDEAREGHGKKITITKYNDFSIEVEDFGRGVPVGYNNAEQCENWQLLYCEMYAGGKYNTNEGENYEFSLGLNGLGLCATQYSSEYMDVVIHRDGAEFSLHFEHGENVGGLKEQPYSGRQTGTKTRWKPDLAVFTEIDVPAEYFRETIRRQAIVNAGVTFVFKNQLETGKFETEDFLYNEGITEYVTETVGEEALTSVNFWSAERRGRDREDKPEYKVLINAALCFCNKIQLKEYYHNSSFLEYGGAPEKAARSAFVSQIDAYLKQNNKYQKSEGRITFSDVEECLMLVISSFSTITSYENQTKKAITNRFIQECMTEFLRHQLEVYFIENRAEAEKIAEQVLINMRSRVRSEHDRLNLKKTLSSGSDMLTRVQKFVDCRSRKIEERELYIVEGDSALGSCKLARDPGFQAVIPVRGKILNCLKADYGRIFKNDIITDLIRVMGCGVEVSSKTKDISNFDINNLKWNKIVICTDADVDGFQIRALILTMLYRLTPTLINEGKVYIAETPLFEINTKEKVYFAYDEREKNEILEKLGDTKYKLQRSKGLGENQPDMMSLTTMNPETRRLIQVLPDEAARTAEMFDLLLGDNLAGRKDFIAENGYLYIDEADVS